MPAENAVFHSLYLVTYVHEFRIYERLFISRGATKCLFAKINSCSNMFDLNRKILPCFKRKQEKFWEKKNREFVEGKNSISTFIRKSMYDRNLSFFKSRMSILVPHLSLQSLYIFDFDPSNLLFHRYLLLGYAGSYGFYYVNLCLGISATGIL